MYLPEEKRELVLGINFRKKNCGMILCGMILCSMLDVLLHPAKTVNES